MRVKRDEMRLKREEIRVKRSKMRVKKKEVMVNTGNFCRKCMQRIVHGIASVWTRQADHSLQPVEIDRNCQRDKIKNKGLELGVIIRNISEDSKEKIKKFYKQNVPNKNRILLVKKCIFKEFLKMGGLHVAI